MSPVVKMDHEMAGTERVVRVAYVTQWFPPEPATIPLWIAQSLRRRGLDVSVVTGIPNYPSGRVQEGYAAWRRTRECIDGFPVLRTPLFPSHDHSAVRRVANVSSYALSSSLLGSSVLRSADVGLVYSSPATAATASMWARLRWGVPYVLLVLDMWPDSVFATDFLTRGVSRRLAERSLTWFTQKAYQGASHVAVTTPGMRDLLLERGVPGDKVSTVFNWVDEKLMQPTEPDRELRGRLGLAGKFVLMYAGNHGPAQALDVAIKAMSEVRDLPDLQLVLIGDGIDKPALRQLARELELQSVHFVDTVEAERVPALMASADLQLVSLADRPLFRITLPSKVQSILACGQPVLCSAAGDAARVIAEAGAGLVAPPGDPVMLAQVLREAHRMPRTRLRDMGEAGREYYRSTLSEEVNAGALASLLGSAARQGRGVGRA